MISECLKKARQYENSHRSAVDKDRPLFHLTPPAGWCNDPNGFSFYKAEYHLFFQYYPYDVSWGTMHWGHAKTKDFVRWEYLPAALAPDQTYDALGCFSGSAIELDDGRHLLIYTGCYLPEDAAAPQIHQQQCIAIGDGVNYQKYAGNPVIGPELIPDEYDGIDFRDPKIWKAADGYHLILGSRRCDGSGSAVLMYHSDDAIHWQYDGVVAAGDDLLGRMWECPDLFCLGDEKVLLFSPQKTEHSIDGYESVALTGTFDPQQVQELDHGTDFYAPQTITSSDGRRIMIGWMQSWASKEYKMTGTGFFGEMSLPRQLSLKNGRVCQQPVREISNYYGRHHTFSRLKIQGELLLAQIGGISYDLTVKIYFDRDPSAFKVLLRRFSDQYFSFSYEPEKNTFHGDRSQAGIPDGIRPGSSFTAPPAGNGFILRFIVDRYSVEVFINGGEHTATYLINCPGQSICLLSEKEAAFDVDFHEIVRSE